MEDADLQNQLTSAFDIGKLFNVFHNMVGVIKEQQEKIDAANSHMSALTEKIDNLPTDGGGGGPTYVDDGGSNETIKALEAKFNQMHEFIHGSEEIDKNNPMNREASNDPFELGELLKIYSRPGTRVCIVLV